VDTSFFDHSNSHEWPVLPSRPPLRAFPYTTLPIQLKTDEVQRILKRRFESFQMSAYVIHHFCARGRRDQWPLYMEALEDELESARVLIEDVRSQAIGWAHGQRHPLRYFEPVPPLCLQIRVRSPLAKDYLELLCQLDEATEVLHAVRRRNSSRRGHWDALIAKLKQAAREIHITARKMT
jgi:hypothetical protein